VAIPNIRAGSNILLRIATFDAQFDPPVLYSPSSGVVITLTNPQGNAIVNVQAMTQISAGIWAYLFQSSTSDVLGIWTVEYKSTDSARVVYTQPQAAFNLISPSRPEPEGPHA
jgi:hypothetical protein